MQQQVCEYVCELSRPLTPAGSCSFPFPSLGGTFFPETQSFYTVLLFVDRMLNCPEEEESASPPGCSGVRLHVGSGRVPTTAGDSDDKAKQTYSRGAAAKRNRVMERS